LVLVGWIWILVRNADPDPGGQKGQTKNFKKVKNFHVFEVLDVPFEGSRFRLQLGSKTSEFFKN
jgi:hypothetical protein